MSRNTGSLLHKARCASCAPPSGAFAGRMPAWYGVPCPTACHTPVPARLPSRLAATLPRLQVCTGSAGACPTDQYKDYGYGFKCGRTCYLW